MIVKIQVSLTTTEAARQFLILGLPGCRSNMLLPPFVTDPVEILERRQATITRTRVTRWTRLIVTLSDMGLDTERLVAAKGNLDEVDAALLAMRGALCSARQKAVRAGCDIPTLSGYNIALDQLGAVLAVMESPE